MFAKFKDDINSIAVSVELLRQAMSMYAELAPEECPFESRAMRVMELLAKKGHNEKRALLAMAIMIRLMALDAILADSEVQGWTLPGAEPGVTYIHSALLTAAAEETVVEGSKGQPMFNAANFRRRVLAMAAMGGRA